MNANARPLTIAIILGLAGLVVADEPTSPAHPVLHLANGDHFEGRLVPADAPTRVRWQSPAFTQPFEFPLAAVASLRPPNSVAPLPPEGELCFEIGQGDLLYGQLVGITDEALEIDSAHFGRLTIARRHVRRFFRNRDAEVIFSGPQGLTGWTETRPDLKTPSVWQEVAGQPTTEIRGAALRSAFDLPAKALIEIEISWEFQADFTLLLGTAAQPGTDADAQAFRVENWGNTLVISRELTSKVDLESLQAVQPGTGRTRWQIYLDQQSGRCLVHAANGKRLADLQVTPEIPTSLPKLALINGRGDMKLERLRVSRWNGDVPQPVDASRTRLHRRDGSIAYADLVAYDPASKQLTIREENVEKQLMLDELSNVFVSINPDAAAPVMRAVLTDGSQVSGDPVGWDREHLRIQAPDVQPSLAIPFGKLRSFLVTHAPSSAAAAPPEKAADGSVSPLGKLVIAGIQSQGRLVDGRNEGESACLVWKPAGAIAGSPLRRDVSGRVIYRELVSPETAAAGNSAAPTVPVPEAPLAQMVTALSRVFTPLNSAKPTASPRSIFLRGGDAFPYTSLSMDEKGITFRTPVSDVTFLPHEQIKAVEFVPPGQPLKLGKTKRNRLLTLPRLQRDSPPTHLVRSTGGDYLRGRLISLDERQLTLEVRLETKQLDRRRLSHIVWLHPDELDQTSPVVPLPPSTDGLRVQAVRGDGVRLTFLPEEMRSATVSGTSPWLGPCHVDLRSVDQLLINQQIAVAATDLPYHNWRLNRATEPKVAQADSGDGSGSPRAGTESPLVGKPAPDFQLPLLQGDKFQLSSRKGKVVVLDFWATWCGPCLRTMPLVEKVISELPKEAAVELIAVNLEETPRQITAMLERHKLQLNVALDEDGAVAAKYAATAIPQTVIIDREGKIVRLFVGGDNKFGEVFRAALDEVLASDPPAAR